MTREGILLPLYDTTAVAVIAVDLPTVLLTNRFPTVGKDDAKKSCVRNPSMPEAQSQPPQREWIEAPELLGVNCTLILSLE